MKIRQLIIGAIVTASLLAATCALQAQFAGTGPRDNFRDTTILRPPAGSKVALIVFEDLGCPACARAHPFEMEAVKQTHVTLHATIFRSRRTSGHLRARSVPVTSRTRWDRSLPMNSEASSSNRKA